MRVSIRKIASLCLAMAMILSTLAMPAFAEERVIHTHSYDIVLSKYTEYIYVDEDTHCLEVTGFVACECGAAMPLYESKTQRHTPSGPRKEHTAVNADGDSYTYYTFTCEYCKGEYPA